MFHKPNKIIMANINSCSGGLNLSLLQNTETVNLKGRECLVIPIADNPTLFIGKKGVYLDISVVETPDSQYGHSHYVRANVGPAKRQNYSREELKALTPILGNLKPYEPKQQDAGDMPASPQEGTAPIDDLPW